MDSNYYPSRSPTPAPRSFKLKNKSFIRSPLITITVGGKFKTESFSVHKDVITEKSDFFKNGLSGRWTNSDTNSITLDHIDPIYFAMYLETLYTNEIDLDDVTGIEVHTTWAKVYVIAEEMLDSSTKDTILRAIRKLLYSTKDTCTSVYMPPPSVVGIIYNGTCSDSNPARRLIVTTWRVRGNPKRMYRAGPHLPHEFLVELACAMMACDKASEETIRDLEWSMDELMGSVMDKKE
jgi:hypothetical protein